MEILLILTSVVVLGGVVALVVSESNKSEISSKNKTTPNPNPDVSVVVNGKTKRLTVDSKKTTPPRLPSNNYTKNKIQTPIVLGDEPERMSDNPKSPPSTIPHQPLKQVSKNKTKLDKTADEMSSMGNKMMKQAMKHWGGL